MPSMSGMWMSESTRSAGVLPSSPSASRPLPASPTTTSGSAAAQSSSSSRIRRRAGASSSTMTSLSGASDIRAHPCHRGSVRHADVHFVVLAVHFAFQARLGIEMQRQRRHERIFRHVLGVPLDDEAIAEAQLLEVEVLAAQLDFVGEWRKLAVV